MLSIRIYKLGSTDPWNKCIDSDLFRHRAIVNPSLLIIISYNHRTWPYLILTEVVYIGCQTTSTQTDSDLTELCNTNPIRPSRTA